MQEDRGRESGNKRFGIITLGCKVNTFESEYIAKTLHDRGWNGVGGRESADLYIINTCTVTREADRQARQEIRRAVRRNPDALIVVTGCYAQMNPHAAASIPGVDLVLGNDRKLNMERLLPKLVDGRLANIEVGDIDRDVVLPDGLISEMHGRTRAFLQVQQGCDQGCTFCIIHRARGPSRSLPASKVIRQFHRLITNGYKEVVVCGIDLGAYGEDLPSHEAGSNLVALLTQLSSLEGDFRVRLSSIDPAHIDDRLIEMIARDRRFCPHLHLSLQSGNTRILKRMKRRYTAEQIYDRVRSLRQSIPHLVLSADIMVGFPTETDDQYLDTENMVLRLDIAYPHIFCYSEREGTPAARIPERLQVPISVRKRRAARLRGKAERIRARLLQRRIGECQTVLIEGGGHPPPGHQRGRAADYIPVFVAAAAEEVGDWRRVRYTGVLGDTLIARSMG